MSPKLLPYIVSTSRHSIRTAPVLLWVALIWLLPALACSFSAQAPGAHETEIAISVQSTQLANKAATVSALQTEVQPTGDPALQDTLAPTVPPASPTPEDTLTPTIPSTSTPRPSATVTDTPEPQQIVLRLQQMDEQGELRFQEGDYHQLDDFDQSMAKINYFGWWGTDYAAENFAILADVSWDVDSKSANWFNTGCGFVFSEIEDDVFHHLQLALDGNAMLSRYSGNNWNPITQKRYGKPTLPAGGANVFLVVNQKRVWFYVDEKLILDASAPLIKSGKISLSLSSGTNAGFGTRCQMTNVELWIFDQ